MTSETFCCEQFEAAQKRGTDFEGYDCAIYLKDEGYTIGVCDPINFCPWCGTCLSGPADSDGADDIWEDTDQSEESD